MSRGRATLDRGFSALAIRNYRIYWFGQGISRTGTWMQQVSLPWLVLALGGAPGRLKWAALFLLLITGVGGIILASRLRSRGFSVQGTNGVPQAITAQRDYTDTVPALNVSLNVKGDPPKLNRSNPSGSPSALPLAWNSACGPAYSRY